MLVLGYMQTKLLLCKKLSAQIKSADSNVGLEVTYCLEPVVLHCKFVSLLMIINYLCS
jgi:hypothetical protein